ncbi:hypothetical protein G7043_36075 [Lentzea sp. NEAU-D13]|uniref:Uncharacterized protein n=2 Tax=Lentzea alba TaxID=2714351 RepID=A0A7C9RX97_9PSEU|nr:hypothetical protein [Lentzea alba]
MAVRPGFGVMTARSCSERFGLIALVAALVLLIAAVALSLVPQPELAASASGSTLNREQCAVG